MISYTSKELESYLSDDWILEWLQKYEDGGAEHEIRTNQWLWEMDNKRLIYSDVYGDVLKGQFHDMRILDVGGGYNSLTKKLASECNYHLLDYMAHGGNDYFNKVFEDYNIHWIDEDWFDYHCEDKFDVIIANDIFPDVDQRLGLFIDKYISRCREMRLVVTFYNEPRFYTTKRVDDTELLTFLSYDWEMTSIVLSHYRDRLIDTTNEQLCSMKDLKESIYRNGRQVSYVVLKGDLV